MNKIRKGDEVVVITGRDKGRRGTVIRVLGDKVLVENVNMIKRHTRPNPQKGTQGGIVEKEAYLNLSNVQLWNPVAKKGDRVGIIAFAGKATLECPLTDDYESVALVLSSLETDSAVQLGTDIGAAMALAEKSFLSSGGNNVLLLVSDGEDLGGSSLQQAQRLASAGARVYTLGVGSAEGVTITDPETGRSTFSRLDARNLEKLASAGKGRYYAVTPGQNELDLILQNIYAEEKGRERSKSISTYKEQYHIPAFLSLAFLLLESLILPLRGRRKQA